MKLLGLFILALSVNSLYWRFVKHYMKTPGANTSVYNMPAKNVIFFFAVILADLILIAYAAYLLTHLKR